MNLVYGQDRRVAEWVMKKAPHADYLADYVAIGLEEDGSLVAGVVYNEYRGNSIHVSIASSHPKWANRKTLFAFFAYPFLQLKVKRLTAYTGKSMASVRKFLERLGFVMEGTMRQGFVDDDCVIYGMLKDECRWIERTSRERQPEPAACT